MGENLRHKIICDPVHGEIPLSRLEQRLIDTPSFQRLRNLKQLGLASLEPVMHFRVRAWAAGR